MPAPEKMVVSNERLSEKVLRFLLVVAFLFAAGLLIRFTIDFFLEMPLWLAIPFSLLVATSLLLAGITLFTGFRQAAKADLARPARAFLLATIPLGFLASALDCSGLALHGCTPFCTLIKVGLIPAFAVLSAVYFFHPMPGLLVVIGGLAFVTLTPHCVCYNVGNGWWMTRLGASPMCYVWGFTATLLALSALQSGRLLKASLLVNLAIIGGATAFFISHHYFHFPW